MKFIVVSLFCLSLSGCLLSPFPKTDESTHFSRTKDWMSLEERLLAEQLSPREDLRPAKRLEVGMGKRGVKRSIGLPTQVEVAGNPEYGNERWTYLKKVSTVDGYFDERQVIYFESGRVVGWEVQ